MDSCAVEDLLGEPDARLVHIDVDVNAGYPPAITARALPGAPLSQDRPVAAVDRNRESLGCNTK
jgi:hypothetical protein